MVTGVVPGRLSRRAVLGGLLGLAAAACTRGGAAAPVVRSCARAASTELVIPVESVALAQAFMKADPSVTAVPWHSLPHVTAADPGPPWNLSDGHLINPPNPVGFPTLDVALRQSNLDPSVFLPGVWDAFVFPSGGRWAMPAFVQPVGVLYREAAFQAAGVAPPQVDWTLDDFEGVCAALALALGAGRVSGVSAVLPQMYTVAGKNLPGDGGPPYLNVGQPSLWWGLVHGCGGTVVSAGRYDLTNPGALTGLGRLTDIVRQYANAGVGSAGAALVFAPYPNYDIATYSSVPANLGVPAGWRYARFPRMPSVPVIPADVVGWTLGGARGVQGEAAALGSAALAAAVEAQVRFCLWYYQTQRTTPALFPAPPVLADAAVQTGYWSAGVPARLGATVVTDPAQYTYAGAGWPVGADGTLGSLDVLMRQALGTAAQGPVDLAQLLAAGEKQVNTDVATHATEVGAALASWQARSSVAAAFPTAAPASTAAASCSG